jgi:hypothetical protein
MTIGPADPRRDAAIPELEPQLAAHREASRSRRAPEVNAALRRGVERLVAEGVTARVPGPGQPAPLFSLGNVLGEEIRLGDLLGRGAVVLVFYRGGW